MEQLFSKLFGQPQSFSGQQEVGSQLKPASNVLNALKLIMMKFLGS